MNALETTGLECHHQRVATDCVFCDPIGLPRETLKNRAVVLTAEESIVRDAILNVFDSTDPDAPRFFFEGHGVPCASGGFERVSAAIAGAERLDFANAVIARARRIKQVDDDEEIRRRR